MSDCEGVQVQRMREGVLAQHGYSTAQQGPPVISSLATQQRQKETKQGRSWQQTKEGHLPDSLPSWSHQQTAASVGRRSWGPPHQGLKQSRVRRPT